jgi:plasmid stabilization system protein ParE
VNAIILQQAEDELEAAFEYFEEKREGLGAEMLNEFRRGVDQIITYPNAWQALDDTYRRCRLHRFPYGIVYRVDLSAIVIVAFMHLSRRPGTWRGRAG